MAKRDRICVCICKNCGKVPVDDTEFVNIEEDYMGRDSYTFICNECGEKSTSNVYC